jgi:hypothetical protein
MREVAGEFERPALLFSGGKDSICLLRLAEKAFRPSDIPMPFLNVDTGHHFPELNEFRDRRARSSAAGSSCARSRTPSRRASPRPPRARSAATACRSRRCSPRSRSSASTAASAAPGATRRRRGPRSASSASATASASGIRRGQRPEIWNLYNGRLNPGENMRVFPLSNWTEMDVWEYIRPGTARGPVHLLQPPAHLRAPPGPVAPVAMTSPAQARPRKCASSPCASAPSATSSAPASSMLESRRHVGRRHHRGDRRRPRDRARLPRR